MPPFADDKRGLKVYNSSYSYPSEAILIIHQYSSGGAEETKGGPA